MSVLAHPGPISFPLPRRRHLTVVPSAPDVVAEHERVADVIELPAAHPAPRRPVASPASVRGADAPLRLTARGRAVLAGLGILAAAVVGSIAGAVVNTPAADPAVVVVTVASGDSLWSIASQVAAPGEDIRDVVSEIAALNNLEGSTLVAGQQLAVPSEG